MKNIDYLPAQGGAVLASGGKIVKVDRVEWVYIPDPARLPPRSTPERSIEWQMVPPDLVPLLTKNKDIKVREHRSPLLDRLLLRFKPAASALQQCKDAPGPCSILSTSRTMPLAIAGDAKQGTALPCRSSPAGSPPKAKSAPRC